MIEELPTTPDGFLRYLEGPTEATPLNLDEIGPDTYVTVWSRFADPARAGQHENRWLIERSHAAFYARTLCGMRGDREYAAFEYGTNPNENGENNGR